MIKFNASRYEMYLIRLIVRRYEKEVWPLVADTKFTPEQRRQLVMDLDAVHSAWPLNLHMMLIGRLGDLGHDIGGITNLLDRRTGKLMDCFSPRSLLGEEWIKGKVPDEALDAHLDITYEGKRHA